MMEKQTSLSWKLHEVEVRAFLYFQTVGIFPQILHGFYLTNLGKGVVRLHSLNLVDYQGQALTVNRGLPTVLPVPGHQEISLHPYRQSSCLRTRRTHRLRGNFY